MNADNQTQVELSLLRRLQTSLCLFVGTDPEPFAEPFADPEPFVSDVVMYDGLFPLVMRLRMNVCPPPNAVLPEVVLGLHCAL